MPHSRFDFDGLQFALNELGRVVEWEEPVELVLVGGAAAILTGLMPSRVTGDCDVVLHVPKDAWQAISKAVAIVAETQGFASDWLNAEVRQSWHRLPADWRGRSHMVVESGVVTVIAIDRLDLLAMKAIAGRAVDRMDVIELKPTGEESRFVRAHLAALKELYPHESEAVDDAVDFLADLAERNRDEA